jgi:hypothetical protein
MPLKTVVVPLMPHSYDYRYGASAFEGAREVNWNKAQQLARGWIESRTTAQYMVLHADKSQRAIKIQSSDGDVRVWNHLQTSIRQLLLCDEAGELYWGDAIDNEASATLRPLRRERARAQLIKTFQENQPRPPEEMSYASERIFGIRSRGYYYWGQRGNRYENARLASSRLEWALALYGPAEPFTPQPRTYLAIVDSSPAVPLGVADAEQDGSFHVIRGLW